MSRTEILACLGSGLLLAFSFPPLSLTFCIFFALIPLFLILQPNAHRHNFQRGFWTGLIFYSFSLYWFLNVTFGGTILLILILSIVFGLLAIASGWVRYPQWRILLAALIWALVEFIRSLGYFSFAWNFIGHSLYTVPTQIQITYWFGVYILTFLIVGFNLALTELIPLLWRSLRDKETLNLSQNQFSPLVYLILFVLVFIGNGFYGTSVLNRLEALQQTEGIPFRIALIQGNYQLGEKENASVQETLATYLTLTENTLTFRPDLIVWPESTITVPLNYWPSIVQELQNFVDRNQVNMLIGTVFGHLHQDATWDLWNRAIYIHPGLQLDIQTGQVVELSHVAHYDKIHLVPYGEFVPFQQIWPMNHIETLIEEAGAGIFERGKDITIFETEKGLKFSVAICYESSRSGQLRESVENGADFIINITNDAWFHNSPGLMQHFILSIFRSAENRCHVIRAANTGITGVIKPGGVVAKTIPVNRRGMCLYEMRVINSHTGTVRFDE